MEALLSYRGHFFSHSFVFSSHQEHHKQHLRWSSWLGNINRMKMSLKSYPKGYEMWCTNMSRLSCPKHETSWNQQHVIHHVVGFIQIPRTKWVSIYTLCYRIPVWATNQSKYLFPFLLEYILWSKIQRWWKHESTRLSSWVLWLIDLFTSLKSCWLPCPVRGHKNPSTLSPSSGTYIVYSLAYVDLSSTPSNPAYPHVQEDKFSGSNNPT